MAETKCPICYNDKGEFTDDPLKMLNHPITTLRGFTPIRARHIKELQDQVNLTEDNVGMERTRWTDVKEIKTMSRRQYINELREAIEAILTHLSIPLADWLSWDENQEPTLGISGWLNGSRLEKVTPVRGMHIEELRKKIVEIGFNVLFCQSGYWGNVDLFPGLARVSSSPTTQYFRKFKAISRTYPEPIDNWGCIFDNVFSQMIIQNGVYHLFQFGNFGYSLPAYSYNTTRNLDIENWQGFIAARIAAVWDFEAIVAAYRDNTPIFNPVVPIYPLDEFGDPYADVEGYEGISGMHIDDSGQDYYMYTIELVLDRYSLGTPADYDWYEYLYWGAPNYIARYKYPKERILGESDGTANQTFDASAEGIVVPLIAASELIYVNNLIWTRVVDFSSSGPYDEHYIISNSTGVISFGDGVNGKIPPLGSEIRIFITLTGGGIWAYEKIIAPRDEENLVFYGSIQAKDGKVFYTKKENAFDVARVKDGGNTSVMTDGYYEKNEFLSVTENENWLFDYTKRGEHSCDHELVVSGSYSVEPNPYWSGTLDGMLDIYAMLHHQTVNVVSDNLSAYQLKFENKDTLVQVSRGYFLPNSKTSWCVSDITSFIMTVSEKVNYGHWDYTPPAPPNPEIWTWVPDPWNEIYMYTNTGNNFVPWDYDGVPTQIFDLFGSIGSSVIDGMTYTHGSGYEQWEKTVGSVYYKFRLQWSPSDYFYMYRKELGNTTRPSNYVPLKVTVGVPGTTGNVEESLFGGSNYGDYYYSYEVTSLSLH